MDVNRVSQGQGKGRVESQDVTGEYWVLALENLSLPHQVKPGAKRATGSQMYLKGPTQSRWEKVKLMISSSLWTLAPRSTELWSSVTRPWTRHTEHLGNKDLL